MLWECLHCLSEVEELAGSRKGGTRKWESATAAGREGWEHTAAGREGGHTEHLSADVLDSQFTK